MLRCRFTPRRLASLHRAIGFALVTLACLVAAWSLFDARRIELREAEQQEGNITASLERNIDRAVTTLDLSLRSAIGGLSVPGLAAMPQETQQLILFDGALTADGVGGVFITDERGRVTHASRDNVPLGSSRADRDYFPIHRDDPGRGLVMTGPVRGRMDGEWTLIFSRRIDRPDGSFGGVAAAGLHLSYFESLFATLRLAPDAVVVLVTADGLLAGRRPPAGPQTGADLRGRPLLQQFRKSPAGAFTSETPPDFTKRLVVYRQVGDLPLVIAVGFSTRAVYANWMRSAELFGVLLVLLGGLEWLLGSALRRELRERGRAEQEATTARAEAERLAAELSWSLARHEALINNSADAMLVARVDALGAFTYETVNPVWERLTGVAAADAAGRTPHACLPTPTADLVAAAWEDCVRQRGVVRFSFRFPGSECDQCWEAAVCPVFEGDGSIRRIIATARNVTEHRRLEAKLRDVNRMEAVGGLTAGFAHDFNNLLQAMLGALELLGDKADLEQERSASIGIAVEAGRRAASLVHQLLAFSRKQVLNPLPLDPGKVARELGSAVRPLLGSRHPLLMHVAAEAGPVLADSVQLNRCLTDLVLNARDATGQGGALHLRVCGAEPGDAVAAGLAPNGYTRFIVEDEGAGIAPETLPRVFEPFFTTKDIGKGAGLGLSMVQGFARQSGGDVTIESAPGLGTAVTLWLPLAKEAPPVAAPAVAQPARRSVPPGGHRVLLVDDEPSVRQTLALILRKAGYATVVAESGQAALAMIGAGDAFDLLVTDQSMPGMTGTELIEAAARLRPSLPGILITGFDRVTGVDRFANRVTVLAKPFQGAALLGLIQSVLAVDGALAPAA